MLDPEVIEAMKRSSEERRMLKLSLNELSEFEEVV